MRRKKAPEKRTCYQGRYCYKCDQHKPMLQFALCADGWKFKDHCLACAPNVRPPGKVCISCKKHKPTAGFERYPGKRCRYRAKCKECTQGVGVATRRKTIKELTKSLSPCMQCKQYFYRPVAVSRIAKMKYCSHRCSSDALASLHRNCTRCKRRLPQESFPRLSTTGNKSAACRACVEERDRDSGIKMKHPRPSAYAMYHNFRRQMASLGKTSDVKLSHVKAFYKQDCALCGRAVCSLRSRDGVDFNAASLRGYCRRCTRLLVAFDHTELLLLAHEIVATNPF